MNIFLNERIKFSGEQWIPESAEHFENLLFDLLKLLEVFNYHTDVAFYYSSQDIQVLITNFQDATGLFSGRYQDKIDLIRAFIDKIEATNWNDNAKQRHDMLYYHQQSLGEATHNVNNTSLAEATEHKFEDAIVAVLNLSFSEYNNSIPIHINRSSINPPRNMLMISLNVLTAKDAMIDFIKSNRRARIYNHNPKHGENGKGMLSNKDETVSPLECSITEARELIKDAISTTMTNELYAYDKARNKFIVYKAESTNIYHGYHPIDQSEVPDNVKKFLVN